MLGELFILEFQFTKIKKVSSILFFTLISIASYGGAWTLDTNSLTFKTSFFYQTADSRFSSTNFQCGLFPCQNGERQNFFFNGKSQSSGIFLDISYGINKRLDAKIQLPYYIISFVDDVDPNRATTSSFGDIRASIRYNVLKKPFIQTFMVEGKAPTGFFNKDAEVVPVGDGQWDLSVISQTSKSLYPLLAYINLDLGYKYRFKPNVDVTNFAPGNEFLYSLEIGVKLFSEFWLKNSINGWYGEDGIAIFTKTNTLVRKNSARRILYYQPEIYWKLGDKIALNLITKIELKVMNMPTGNVYGIGVSYKIKTKKSIPTQHPVSSSQ